MEVDLGVRVQILRYKGYRLRNRDAKVPLLCALQCQPTTNLFDIHCNWKTSNSLLTELPGSCERILQPQMFAAENRYLETLSWPAILRYGECQTPFTDSVDTKYLQSLTSMSVIRSSL